MFNGRLYTQGWLIALLALLVAFLTLRAPEDASRTQQPAPFQGSATTNKALEFQEAAPLRVPGTVGAQAAEKWITDQFSLIQGLDLPDVAVQRTVIRREGQDIPLANVSLTVPARAQNTVPRRILVVAPRDAPRQVTGGGSSTAILAELARLAAQQRYRHPITFLSVDGDTMGSAGLRWYLSRERSTRFAGVIILDAPGEGHDEVPVLDPVTGRQRTDPNTGRLQTRPASDAQTIYLWSTGTGKQALDMRRMAERAVAVSGFAPSPMPSLRRQLLDLSFTEARGAQRAAIDEGIPAVTLSARTESPLPVGVPPISTTRVRAAGVSALALMGLLDDRERANSPDGALAYAGRDLRPVVARIALLVLILPLLIVAIDAAVRVRRSRVRLGVGLRAMAWRTVPILVVLLVGWLVTLWGVLDAPLVGRPLPPSDLPFDGRAVLTLLLVLLAGLAVTIPVRSRLGRLTLSSTAEIAACALWLSAASLIAWWHMPYALVLILPVAHCIVAATMVPRVWQMVMLTAGAVVVPLIVLGGIAATIDRGPFYAVWYVVQTTLSGARGMVGPILAAMVVAAVGALLTLIAVRIRAETSGEGGRRGGLRSLVHAPQATTDPAHE